MGEKYKNGRNIKYESYWLAAYTSRRGAVAVCCGYNGLWKDIIAIY